jgi:hypothetical protein
MDGLVDVVQFGLEARQLFGVSVVLASGRASEFVAEVL